MAVSGDAILVPDRPGHPRLARFVAGLRAEVGRRTGGEWAHALEIAGVLVTEDPRPETPGSLFAAPAAHAGAAGPPRRAGA